MAPGGKTTSFVGTPPETDVSIHARKVLATRLTGVRGNMAGVSTRQMVQKANISGLIFPWMIGFKIWWSIISAATIFTVFYSPYFIAFGTGASGVSAAIYYILLLLFLLDMVVKFNLAFYENGVLVYDRRQIARKYLRRMFWIDLIGVFPFDVVAMAAAGVLGQDSREAELLSLLNLLIYARLYRLKKLSDMLQYSTRISFAAFTLIRNYFVALAVTHFSGCIMYFIARLDDFGEDTWIGPVVDGMDGWERYVASLYWSVTTFATVGYGDFHAVNANEMVWGIIFMFFNLVAQSWFIGSITLLVVKGDEKTGKYRDSLATLNQYADMHQFDEALRNKLRTQLRLEFHNHEISDDEVLKNFPSAMRSRVLRRLYLPFLSKTHLMKGVRQQFVDAFLSACTVEIFTPGEEIVERGSIMSDLFLLVGGIAEITTRPVDGKAVEEDPSFHSVAGANSNGNAGAGSSSPSRGTGNDPDSDEKRMYEQVEAGDFVGEIGFFTESPQVDTVTCVTVCKSLTLSKSAYKLIAQDHPGSVGKILQNLLTQVENIRMELPKSLSVLRAGSVFDFDSNATYGAVDEAWLEETRKTAEATRRKNRELTAIKDLVKMHMSKQKDDQTTRFLFAASRGDIDTITLMCDQGFDANSADYDNRTALMVAAMKDSDAVKTLLEYGADPNLADVHGTTALHEAVKHGHEQTMELLLSRGAMLCMAEHLAASVLCQAVFDGDILFLRRLLRAGANVNAADYDKRTAAHIAAAEGNVAALRVLVEANADLTLEDRWGNTVDHEAARAQAGQLIDYLRVHRESVHEP